MRNPSRRALTVLSSISTCQGKFKKWTHDSVKPHQTLPMPHPSVEADQPVTTVMPACALSVT
jgi:uracil-DNA glycosylase